MSKISDGVGGRGDDPASLEATLANIAEAAAAFTERHGGSPTHVQLGAEFNALRAQVQDEIIEDGLMLIPKALGGRQIIVSRPVGKIDYPSPTPSVDEAPEDRDVPIEEPVYFDSSRLAEGVWFEDGDLQIVFQDSTAYWYYKVPKSVWAGLVVADSPGRYFDQYIKGVYEYARIEEE
jgi:hypothetical protein